MAGMGEKQGVQVVLENGAPGIAAVHPVLGDTVEPDSTVDNILSDLDEWLKDA